MAVRVNCFKNVFFFLSNFVVFLVNESGKSSQYDYITARQSTVIDFMEESKVLDSQLRFKYLQFTTSLVRNVQDNEMGFSTNSVEY